MSKNLITDLKILAVIPARSGSKSLVNKNILEINGIPLIGISCIHASNSKVINRIILSTDDESYAEIGLKFGAEIPFLRPKYLAMDQTTDIEVFRHLLEYLNVEEGYKPDIVVHLRPTYPYRKVSDIDNMINTLINNPEASAVRSVCLSEQTPYKMWKINDNGFIKPILESNEAYNLTRQLLPKIYIQNGSIDVTRYNNIIIENSMTGQNILPFVHEHNYDIDDLIEFNYIKELIEKQIEAKK